MRLRRRLPHEGRRLAPLAAQPVTPFNVERPFFAKVHPKTELTNYQYQELLKDTVWQYYGIVTTQWPRMEGNQALPVPSPALTKALMMNSARYMTGVGANDTLPSNNQGMGEISLNNYFDIFATAHALRDQVPAEKFTASGQQRVITGSVSDISKPLRITLVWTDAPGPTTGNAFVNNLDLEVTAGGATAHKQDRDQTAPHKREGPCRVVVAAVDTLLADQERSELELAQQFYEPNEHAREDHQSKVRRNQQSG
jgi:hypothetical protein